MKRREFLKDTALTAAALGTASLSSFAAAKKKPNVIVILSDDIGYGDFSCHGNPVLKTPCLDRIAKEGTDFTDFHVTPVCTPTRGQLMTGMDCLHNLACSVTAGRTIPRRDIPTMADLFRKGGYATGIFGKWHLGHDYPDRPMDRGFDKAVWFKGWGLQSEIEFDNDYVNPRYLDGTETKRASAYCTDLWFQEAIAWMTRQKDKGKPFLAYIPTNAAHMPLWAPEKYADLYKDAGQQLAPFYAMMANLDDNIGQLDDWLKKSGIYRDTIVVFMTDNGSAFMMQGGMGRGGMGAQRGGMGRGARGGGANASAQAYNAGLREGKASNYDGGHRVACFFRFPEGKLESGLQAATPTQIQDILPTLLDLCEVSPGKAAFDGVSLVPLMKKQQIKDRMFVVQYGQRLRPVKYDGSIIWNQWRLQKGKELYDIVKDRAQQTDVVEQFPDVVNRMKAFYEGWWAKLEPGISTPIPMLLGTAAQNPVMLTSIDWWEVDADNINFVSNGTGGPRGGAWNVQVESAGKYRIELRRWPFHTNKPIGSEGPRVTVNGRPLTQQVKLMPAHEVVLSVNGTEQSVRVKPEDLGGVLEFNLSKGKGKLQGWFRDADGNDLCGAYYALVTKLPA
jgi:arylsulfatase A-like enzyme